MRRYPHVICVRLSDEEWQHYQNLLQRFTIGFGSKAERFRQLIKRLDLPYATVWDKAEGNEQSSMPSDEQEDPDEQLPAAMLDAEEEESEEEAEQPYEPNIQFVDVEL